MPSPASTKNERPSRQPGAHTLPIALTMGDPAGIGPDITLAAWQRRHNRALPPFVLYANAEETEKRARRLGLDIPIERITHPSSAPEAFQTALPVIDLPLAVTVTPGTPSPENAAAVICAIDQAVDETIHARTAAVVTNPISKTTLYGAGFTAPGHTEYLAQLAARAGAAANPNAAPPTPVMMLVGADLRVVPATIHIPLADVPDAITQDLITTTANIMAHALEHEFALGPNPHIAITGLNPHAGEDGTIGTQDRDIVLPAIEELKSDGLNVTGPHPADTLFHATARKTYDAVLAMYHDQALIPIKTLAFDTGVNVTLGLPFVRTSPDHGTAFNIAGTGKASPESLIAALKLAADLSVRKSQTHKQPI